MVATSKARLIAFTLLIKYGATLKAFQRKIALHKETPDFGVKGLVIYGANLSLVSSIRGGGDSDREDISGDDQDNALPSQDDEFEQKKDEEDRTETDEAEDYELEQRPDKDRQEEYEDCDDSMLPSEGYELEQRFNEEDCDGINEENDDGIALPHEDYEFEQRFDEEELRAFDGQSGFERCENERISSNNPTNSATPKLFPKHFYTTIFNHRNTIYGKGKFYNKRERIQNLLHKWESDDMKQIQESFDSKEDGIENSDDVSLKEMTELKKLKSLIYERAWKYIDEVRQAENKSLERGKIGIPHPKKFLHYITPKIPAVKKSPEITLRIKAVSINVDSSAAACALGVIAALTEYYTCVVRELETAHHEQKRKEDHIEFLKHSDELGVFEDIITDRRFEQLVECVQCGVDMDDTEDHSVLCLNAANFLYEFPILKNGLNSIDVCRTIWAMMAFLSHHDVNEIGGRQCSVFMQGLQRYSNVLLIHRLNDLLSGQKSLSQSTDKSEDFLIDIKSLLKDTTTALWACERTTKIVQYFNRNLVQTCCFILLQDVKQAWLLRLKRQEEESNVDDIVERLAESEETHIENSDTNDDKDDALNKSCESKRMVTDNQSTQNILTDLEINQTILLHFLSMRDLVVTLKSVFKIGENNGIINSLTKAISKWIEIDLQSVHQNADSIESTPVEFVDAESVLAPNTCSVEEDNIDQEQSFDQSKLSISLNDLCEFVWILRRISDKTPSYQTLQQCMQLSLLFFEQEKIHSLDNESMLKLFEGSLHHAENHMLSERSKGYALNFYSNITAVIISRVTEKTDGKRDFTTIEPSHLISLLSSLHALNQTSSVSQYDVGQIFDLNFLIASATKQVMENTRAFSLDDLCRISWVFTQCHSKETLPLSLCKYFGRIVAKVYLELDRWQKSYDCSYPVYFGKLSFPCSFEYLVKLFVGLAELDLYPLEWCTAISLALQNLKPKIKPGDKVRLLHASAEMRATDSNNDPLSSLRLNLLVKSILEMCKDDIGDLGYSCSHEEFIMFIWSFTTHGVKDLEKHIKIPDGLSEEIHSISLPLQVKLLIALTLSFTHNEKALKLISMLLNNLHKEAQLLSTFELCGTASCSNFLRRRVNRSLNNKDDNEESMTVYEELGQSLDIIMPTILSCVKAKKEDFSIEQMKTLLSSFECKSIQSEIETMALQMMKNRIRMNVVDNQEMNINVQKGFFGMKIMEFASGKSFRESLDSDSMNCNKFPVMNPSQVAYDSGWIQEFMIIQNE